MKTKIITIITVFLAIFTIANFCYAAQLIPNDPDYGRQWYLKALNMPEVWGTQTGNNSVIVAVLDSGVDIAHPDLRDNIWVNRDEILGDNIDNDKNGFIDDGQGWDFVNSVSDPRPKFESDCFLTDTCSKEAIIHGTLVSGVIAAMGNNYYGTTGLAWNVKIMPLRVLDENGSGDTSNVLKAINYAVDNGANIINLSFVGDSYDSSLEKAIEQAYLKNVLVIAAAGNEGTDGHSVNMDFRKMYPVCSQGSAGENIIIGVAAVDQDNVLSKFSNYGSSCIDIAAPGENIYGPLYYADYSDFFNYFGGEYSGTSLAAPIVSGIGALIKSQKPTITSKEITDLILNNGDNIDAINPFFAGKLGKGLINPVKIFKSITSLSISGNLIKGSGEVVYYYGADGKRYAFPDRNTYFSWYANFSSVLTISDTDLAIITLGGIVNYRPGSLIKINSLPNVYAVTHNGILRWIKTEEIAKMLYGENWAILVRDVPDSFFINYKIGEAIETAASFSPTLEREQNITIDIDKELN
ncbi:S8 family serine peptidase [Candidatus Falkowbacteria bacterium]|nr:S8 family serine peptidase [Candidatus Falkowbacteria bacterium]